MLLQPISNWKETGKQYDNNDSLLVKGGIQSAGWDRRTPVCLLKVRKGGVSSAGQKIASYC